MSLLKTSTYTINKKNKVNGLDLLADINDKIIATAFFDPQYRGGFRLEQSFISAVLISLIRIRLLQVLRMFLQ